MSKPTLSHWWMYEILVENSIRNSSARVQFRWYKDDITRFEAVWAAGPRPQNSDGNISIYINEKLVGVYDSKADAVGQVRGLIEKCPPACKPLFEQNQGVFLRAIHGKD